MQLEIIHSVLQEVNTIGWVKIRELIVKTNKKAKLSLKFA